MLATGAPSNTMSPMRYFPDADGFVALSGDAQIIPVYRQLLADHLTPVTAFEVLGRDDHAFLLESVVGVERAGRYSFIGTSPAAVYLVFDGRAAILRANRPPEEFLTVDPLADLRHLLAQRTCRRDPSLPPFTGGLVGFAGYDTARYYEPDKLSNPPKDDRRLPDLLFGLYNELVIFDHFELTIKVVANADRAKFADPDDAYRDACHRVDELVQRLRQPTVSRLGEINAGADPDLPFSSNMTREQFEDAIRKGQRYIRDGEISGLVPSHRLRIASEVQPFEVYRALRMIDPSAHMFYLKSPVCVLMGSSPQSLRQELPEGPTAFEALKACLPLQTIRGAPTIRAMQIIDELEPTRRGPYGGVVGYVDFAGNLDACAAQRTIVWHNGSFDVQVAVAVSADSIPRHAYDQTMTKAKAILHAVQIAEKAF